MSINFSSKGEFDNYKQRHELGVYSSVELNSGKDSRRLHVCSYVDGDYNHCFNSDELTLNQYYNVKIKQYQKDLGIEGGVFGPQKRFQAKF